MPNKRTAEIERPLCACGTPVMRTSYTLEGYAVWTTACTNCRYAARKHRKDYCEKCGGTNRLSIDHIDGNRQNNNLNNLQTLCKPSHDIKTTENNEWNPRK